MVTELEKREILTQTEREIEHEIKDYSERYINTRLTLGHRLEQIQLDKVWIVNVVSERHSKTAVIEAWNRLHPEDQIWLY